MRKTSQSKDGHTCVRSGSSPQPLPERLDRSLSAYALAAGAAGVGMLALAQPAKADIIFTPLNIPIQPCFGFPSCVVAVDFLTVNGKAEFQLVDSLRFIVGTSHGQSHLFGTQGSLRVYGRQPGASAVGAGFRAAAALPGGARIGPGAPFTSAGIMANDIRTFFCPSSAPPSQCPQSRNYRTGPWKNVSDGFLGLRFDIDGQPHFGWAELSGIMVANGQVSATLEGVAYNTVANQPILAGEVPEPGTLGLLALGSLGLAAWRRKKQEPEARSQKSEQKDVAQGSISALRLFA